jgi:creatinine amidohydrolase/Fe(II)-dependent formamide hydrolase-like protein
MSDSMNRRTFVGGAVAGALAGQTAAAQQPEPPAQPAPAAGPVDARNERIVRLDLLTSREVGEWMRAGGDTVFVPHGPVSGHGPWTSLGVHTHGAEAVATLLARKCNGVVFPPIFTCFAGATKMYPGTVPFSYEFHIQVLKATARTLVGQGFGRVFLLCYTNPEDAAGLIAARDLFDIEGELPVSALVATKGMNSDPVRALLADYQGSAGEAIIDYAAMRIIGRERPIAEPELARAGLRGGQDQNADIRETVNTLRRSGTRGFRYDAEREHSSHGTVGLTFRNRPDIELGHMILDSLADYLLPAVDALRRHKEYLRTHPARRIEAQRPLPP